MILKEKELLQVGEVIVILAVSKLEDKELELLVEKAEQLVCAKGGMAAPAKKGGAGAPPAATAASADASSAAEEKKEARLQQQRRKKNRCFEWEIQNIHVEFGENQRDLLIMN